ncbi:hypothetical protein M407DRAFT_31527 [Tulasnella calospora MUT 4182]|uniref:BTB domain-containing protein n=1 Tax=Tulasnella calospora MUT 4182 TaxID=1051891 RepID=A0A0C3KBI7_9AGAM|nr:hypothetical protein M407DRAFT_31527 [Tulasnella calospora MUT 4182]
MPSKHAKYGDASYLVFLAEDTLFHIPVWQLRESQYFRDMIDECHTGSEGEGKSDENPIKLGGITAFEMACFLDALNARFLPGDPKLEFQQWAAALHLATMWTFNELRNDIITHVNKTISSASSMDRIDASLKCKVEEWLHPAYQALCERENGLTHEEAQHLGLGRAAAIWRIRESYLIADSGCWNCGSSSKCWHCGKDGKRRNQKNTNGVIERIKVEDVLKFE